MKMLTVRGTAFEQAKDGGAAQLENCMFDVIPIHTIVFGLILRFSLSEFNSTFIPVKISRDFSSFIRIED